MNDLVLGPLLRHVDEESACIWVETARAGTVRVEAGDSSGESRTFGVHGHHYALVCVDGLEKGTKYPYTGDTGRGPSACTATTTRWSASTGSTKGAKYPYTVEVDGEQVWPPADSPYPPSVIPTLDQAKPLRLAFGSCRTSVTHDAAGNKLHGVDALRAYALRMAGESPTPRPTEDPDPGDEARWPDLVLFLGDQVYADETTQEMREFIESRREHRAAAGDRAQGLRGVRRALPAGVDRPGEPVAAVDRADA